MEGPAAPACPELGSTMREDTSTASKAEPGTWPRVWRLVLFQRESGAPEMYHADPLSAITMPYFFNAVRITWTSGGKGEISKPAFSRKRWPIGGYAVLVLLDA